MKKLILDGSNEEAEKRLDEIINQLKSENKIGEIMLWLSNLESITTNGTAGTCPHCKSENTAYSIYKLHDDIGCGDVWCNDCKKAYHISRMKVTNQTEHITELPEDLIY